MLSPSYRTMTASCTWPQRGQLVGSTATGELLLEQALLQAQSMEMRRRQRKAPTMYSSILHAFFRSLCTPISRKRFRALLRAKRLAKRLL